jgi:hypothetical protein
LLRVVGFYLVVHFYCVNLPVLLDVCAIAADGEEIIMYILLKTTDEEVLNRKVRGQDITGKGSRKRGQAEGSRKQPSNFRLPSSAES